MKNSLITALCFVLFIVGATTSLAQKNSATGDVYGKSFNPKKVVAATALPAQVTTEKPVPVQVEGTVKSVCQAKGCWMRVDVGNGQEMLVKFKDYGFFVPTTSAGKHVILNGTAFQEVTPVDELRHYAKDAGKSDEEIAKITEPEKSLQFEAEGVIIKK